jgi:hypothetical protein
MTDILSTTSKGTGPVAGLTAIVIGASAVLVAGIGTAVAVGSAIGGGQQPEEVLPKKSIAVMKVDLAPSLGQRKAVYDISRKFNGVQPKSVETVKDDLLEALFNSDGTDLDYATDVKPWLGDRVAVAVVPDSSEDHVAAVAAVQYTDKAQADRILKQARADSPDDPFAYAFVGDYVLVATTQAEVDGFAKSAEHLSDNSLFNDAINALDGDQIVTGWADVKGVYDVLPEDQRQQAKLDDASGSFVVGAHADSRYVEIQGKAVDVGDSLKQYGATQFATGRGHNLIATMPIETTLALEITGLGDTLTKAYDSLAKEDWFGSANEAAAQYGLTLPDDLRTIFGTDLGVGIFGNLDTNPQVVGHVMTEKPDDAIKILTQIPTPEDTPPFALEREGDNSYFIGTDAGAIQRARKGTLGGSAPFKRALPDAEDAGFALYVSIGRAAQFAGDSAPDDIKQLEAFGMTANGETGEFRIRLTFN